MGAYEREITNRGNILEAIRRLEKSQKALEERLPREHMFVNGQVTDLYNSVRSSNIYHHSVQREKEHRMEGLQLVDLLITHILHVQDGDDGFRNYYRRFITDRSDEFEARFEYVDAMVDFLEQLGALNHRYNGAEKPEKLRKIWSDVREAVIEARGKLKGRRRDIGHSDYRRYLRSPYAMVNDFRQLLIQEYHRLDKPR